jgi:hypothetical protein
MRFGHRLGLRAAITIERRPVANEGERRSIMLSANHTTSGFPAKVCESE